MGTVPRQLDTVL